MEIDYVDPEEVALGEASHGHGVSPAQVTPFPNSCIVNPIQCWIIDPVSQWLTDLETTIRLWFDQNKSEFILAALALIGMAVVSVLLVIPGVTAGIAVAVSAIVGGVFGLIGYHLTKDPKERTLTGYGLAFITGVISGVGKLGVGGWIKSLLNGVRISMPGFPTARPT